MDLCLVALELLESLLEVGERVMDNGMTEKNDIINYSLTIEELDNLEHVQKSLSKTVSQKALSIINLYYS